MSNNVMTQNSDRSSNDLETIKEILLATARRAEATDARLDRLSENQSHAQEQLNQQRESLDRLREDVDIAFETINLVSENNDRQMVEFRTNMLRLQVENQRIWEYLMRQYQSGNDEGGDHP